MFSPDSARSKHDIFEAYPSIFSCERSVFPLGGHKPPGSWWSKTNFYIVIRTPVTRLEVFVRRISNVDLAEYASNRASQGLLICRAIVRKQQSRLNRWGFCLNSEVPYRVLSLTVSGGPSYRSLPHKRPRGPYLQRRYCCDYRYARLFLTICQTLLHRPTKIGVYALHRYLTMSEPHACRRGFIVVCDNVKRHDAGRGVYLPDAATKSIFPTSARVRDNKRR